MGTGPPTFKVGGTSPFGNACVSRREIISSFKKEDKAKIIEKFKVGDIIKGAEVKGYSTFGCFFNVNNELDVLVHLQEISYSRVNLSLIHISEPTRR